MFRGTQTLYKIDILILERNLISLLVQYPPLSLSPIKVYNTKNSHFQVFMLEHATASLLALLDQTKELILLLL